ncbi:hypothetical protein ACIRQF_25880 [Streptomyces sp. NPDC101191]|uniref:hypothetical protein n=1 Tax=Streptomyces sp. NPDC101191 TaxID=3366126 RepID=UPI00380EF1B5
MTTAEVWRTTDRLLPLGEAADGAWIAEWAVRDLLLSVAAGVRGVVPGRPRFRLARAAGTPLPVPPGGLPPGALEVSLDFAAVPGRPLPVLAERLRAALLEGAEGALGLPLEAVNLRVTELLDAAPDPAPPVPPPGRTTPPVPDSPAALAALAVPGVAALTDVYGAPLQRDGGRLRVELAVTGGRRPLDVVRTVRTALTAAAPEATAVTVLVSELR